ncbi:MAG: tRNA (cytidine(56)-2'-O)-methyltransferase [Thaumarchaeota archaeon]|nr:tRNA (cytidine(56)-2'-O)-methyltransferase [Nitrososphaerota archaeon]
MVSDRTVPNIDVTVLRLGHRLVRDERISTHIGLVSRAFGARKLVLTGADDYTTESIGRVRDRWGGNFEVNYVKSWREFVSKWEGLSVHLTMYGEPLDDSLKKIRIALKSATRKNLLLVIGAEKVPAQIYSAVNYNVSIGNQPHSEVAALAVFLDRLFMGGELYSTFERARLRIKPSARGKKVEIADEN